MEAGATWNLLCDAWSKEQWDDMKTHAIALIHHINAGGAAPNVLSREDMGRGLNEVLVRAACAFVLDRSKESGTEANKCDVLNYLRGYAYGAQ